MQPNYLRLTISKNLSVWMSFGPFRSLLISSCLIIIMLRYPVIAIGVPKAQRVPWHTWQSMAHFLVCLTPI